jgi:hypothetical protein
MKIGMWTSGFFGGLVFVAVLSKVSSLNLSTASYGAVISPLIFALLTYMMARNAK